MLEVKNLHKSYNKNIVLNNLSLKVDDSEIVALIGINGSGKTTLLELICGIKKIDSGDILINDINLKDRRNIIKVKNIIGYMPQSFSLFNDLTVKENLKYLATIYNVEDKERVNKTIDMCYLKDKENYLAKNLSGGFKQLLSLAGSIIHNPKFLILDEPTSAMDPLFRKQFWEIVHNCNKIGTTVLVTTHYMEEIFECDTLMCLAKGNIIHQTPIKDLFENGKFSNISEVLNYYILKENK
jgi:ABC-2 type transport system ATP-binding protein